MHVQRVLGPQQQQLRNGETTLTARGAESWGPDKRAVASDLCPQDAVKGPGGALADERAARTSERAPSARENITLRTKIVARVLGEKGMPPRSACVRFCRGALLWTTTTATLGSFNTLLPAGLLQNPRQSQAT